MSFVSVSAEKRAKKSLLSAKLHEELNKALELGLKNAYLTDVFRSDLKDASFHVRMTLAGSLVLTVRLYQSPLHRAGYNPMHTFRRPHGFTDRALSNVCAEAIRFIQYYRYKYSYLDMCYKEVEKLSESDKTDLETICKQAKVETVYDQMSEEDTKNILTIIRQDINCKVGLRRNFKVFYKKA